MTGVDISKWDYLNNRDGKLEDFGNRALFVNGRFQGKGLLNGKIDKLEINNPGRFCEFIIKR